MSVYINTDVSKRFFSTEFMMHGFDVSDLELGVELEEMYGDRLKEIGMDNKYFDSFKEVLREFEEFGFHAGDIDELNQCLEKFNIRVYEYESEEVGG